MSVDLTRLYERAKAIKGARARSSFTLDNMLASGPQRDFGYAMLRKSRTATHAGRRAGKTTAEAAVALWDTGEKPFVPQFYMTLTRANAKKIFWPELLDLNERYNLGCEINIGELWIRRPGGAPLYLVGADNQRELEKVRGNKFKRGIIDEAGHFRYGFVEQLIKHQLQAALTDYGGKLTISGTPGTSRVGYFFDICKGKLSGKWDVHHWTLADNPRFPAIAAGKTAEQIFAEVRAEFAWDESDPTFRREYLGEFVEDLNARLYQYEADRNGRDAETIRGACVPGQCSAVVGIDLGADDATAVACVVWRRHENVVRLVHEAESPGDGRMTIDGVVAMARPVIEKWKPQAIVIDQGGLGKLIANSIRDTYGIPVQAAEKSRKGEHIKMFNNDLRAGRIEVDSTGIWARDAMLVERDPKRILEEKLEEKAGGYHSNITDAVLYAWREARSYLETPAPPPKSIEETLFEERLRRVSRDAKREPSDELASMLGYDQD